MMDWNNLKLFSREELMEMIPEVNGKPFKFKTVPWKHQLSAFIANTSNDGFLDALDLGTGKTKVAIDTVSYHDKGKKKIKVLFLCLNAAIEKMRDEVLIHSELTPICLRGSTKERWDLFDRRANFYIINYEGLRHMVTERLEKVGYDGKVKRHDAISKKLLKKIIDKGFDVVVLDESHTIKNRDSLIYNIVFRICKNVKNRILLTGTPFGNTPIDIWSQYMVVDRGETFGYNFFYFRNKYFENKEIWLRDRVIPNWQVTSDGEKEIKKKLFTYAIRYEEDEVDDLPPKVFRTLNYELSKSQKKEYYGLLNDEKSDLLKDIKNRSMALRQICSGFIKKTDYLFRENPKLELLFSLVDTVIENHKIVIFTEFTKSRELIEAELKKKKIRFVSLSGETPSNKKYKIHNEFQTNKKCRVIVCQIKSGGASIDLFAATYCVYYEEDPSVIMYKQSLKRIHRGGQTKRCYFYSLLGTGTVEIGIHKDLEDGVDAFTRIANNSSAKKYLIGE